MFNLVVHGGTVLDGTGAVALRADVGASDGRIAAAGFVDTHSHADAAVAPYPGR